MLINCCVVVLRHQFRHLIDITLDEDTADHRAGTTIKALVYSGSTDNPNFLLMGDGAELGLGHIIDVKNSAGKFAAVSSATKKYYVLYRGYET